MKFQQMRHILKSTLPVSPLLRQKKSLKPSPASTLSSSLSPRDEIYIDDEGLEGSGRGGPHDDLEKDHDFSGSGFGPDDEDSDADYHHHSHTHTQTGKSNINKKIDDNDFITSSRNNNYQNQNHHQTSSSGTNIGSGITNHQGNTGIISSGGSSGGSTGLNTIDNKNQHHNPPNKVTPSITTQHSDGDDFDLDGDIDEEETGGGPLFHHSGDGGFIHRPEDDDDDHTGDDDDEDDGDIIKPSFHDDLGKTKPYDDRKPVVGNKDEDDDFGEIDVDAGQPIDHGHKNDDDIDMDEHDDHEDDDKDDDYDISKTKEDADDDSPIYTDITDPTNTDSSSSSSTSTSTTTDKRPGGINTQGGTNIHDLDTNSINSLQPETKVIEQTTGNEVLIMNANDDDRTASFFAQPGILAAVIGGAVVGLLCAILVVMFIVYRMRKKDEGSYALDEPKRSPAMNSYAKNATNREFYA
ncbi:syndecan [Haematobia irritans]|uniref:syndecan n=1 Tax=Haematobia irritans TaxID=7368 RepID=UPI003F4FCB39